jgi:hypothetical protein
VLARYLRTLLIATIVFTALAVIAMFAMRSGTTTPTPTSAPPRDLSTALAEHERDWAHWRIWATGAAFVITAPLLAWWRRSRRR